MNNHQKKAKYCLALQGKIEISEFKCEYCNKTLSSKQSFELHVKKCELITEKNLFDCIYCNKILSSKQNLYNHQLSCIEKKSKEIEELKEQIKDLEKLKNLKIINERIESQLEEYKKQNIELQKTIERLSMRPTITTTNNTVNNTLNISSSLDFNNIDKITDKINEEYNINYAVNGQRGIAQFLVDKVLTDDNGKLIYICTDPSRQIFKYKDNDGEIKKDVEAKKLTNYIVNGGIKRKTVEVSEKWYTDEDGKMDMEKFNIMMDPQQNVINIKDDNTVFKKELASMTTD